MYFGNGGGIIGNCRHERVAAATRRWLRAARRGAGLPGVGETQFVAITTNGRSALAAHDVITELRIIDEG